MKVSVVGLGKLGLCTAVCIARAGCEVWGMDVRSGHVDQLRRGSMPFFEAGLEEAFFECRKFIHLTNDLAEAARNSDVSLIIVPTPSLPDGSFSNVHVAAVLRDLAPVLRDKDGFHVVDVVSTVMPGTGEKEFIPLLEGLSGKKAGRDFGYAYNPEFIAIGSVIRDFLNPDVVLVGESDARTGDILQELYTAVCDNAPFIGRTSIINAEIAKLSINCYCTMKISFANNLAALCGKVPGSDAAAVARIIGRDSRIGDKYLRPGLGFGGPCFPRDNEAFIRFIRDVGGVAGLQQAVVDINKAQVDRIVGDILAAAGEFGPRVALLGQAYKPHTYLAERSQALDVARELAGRAPSLQLSVYDPMAREPGPWSLAGSLEACVSGAGVAAILTPWPEFFTGGWRGRLASPGVVLDFWKA